MKSRRDTGSFVEDWAAVDERRAIIIEEQTLTYGELDRLVRDRVEQLGMARRLVLIESASRLEPLVTYLAALRAGHPVMVVPSGPTVDRIVADYQPDTTLLPDGESWSLCHLTQDLTTSAHPDLHPDLAVLLSTSGSTGVSKFVRLSERNLIANAESIAEYLAIRPDDTALLPLPLHYCYGLSVLHSHLLRRASVVITDTSVVDPCFWHLVADHDVTTFPAVPFTFELLDRVGFESKEVPSLRYITQAGGKLAPETVRRYARLGETKGFDLVVMYGATEATARMAYLPPELAASHPTAIGRAIPGGSLELADDGELIYRGANVMMGYATSADDLTRGSELDALATGDLARIDDDGLFEIVGRKSRFLKMFGLRISLDAMEQFVADETVGPCAATGTDDQLVIATEAEVDTAALQRRVVGRFGLPMSAVTVLAVDTLPRLANDKIDYMAIRSSVPAPPEVEHCDVSASAAALFGRLLGAPQVDDCDSFVSLGGDSLSYVEASIELEAMLGEVPPAWHLMTVADLDEVAQRRHASGRGRWSSWLRSVETGVAIRALAIVAIMSSHFGLFSLSGGAHVLLAAAGYNFSRFALGAIDTQNSARSLGPVVARIMVPTSLWVIAVFLLSGSFEWSILLYWSHLTTDAGGGYWFIEILVQILAVSALAFSVPTVRALHRVSPYLFAVGVMTLALYLRFGIEAIWNTEHIGFKTFHMSFWLFAIGWVADRSSLWWQRLALSGVVAVTVPSLFDSASRTAIITLGVLALIWVPTVRVPAPVHRVLGAVGGASLYLYLVHFQVNTVLIETGVVPDDPLLKLAVALAAGLVAAAIWNRIFRIAARV